MNKSPSTFVAAAAIAVVVTATASLAQTPPPPPPPPPTAPPAVPPVVAPPDIRARSVGGAFTFAGGDRERNAVVAAIERATADLTFLIRGFARSRLTERNQPYPHITIRFPAGYIEVLAETRPLFRSPDTGASAPWRGIDNTEYRLTQRIDGDRIVQEITNSDGTRRNVITVSPDGHSLTLSARLTSPRIATALAYTLSYRR